jgi:hypothetical protein
MVDLADNRAQFGNDVLSALCFVDPRATVGVMPTYIAGTSSYVIKEDHAQPVQPRRTSPLYPPAGVKLVMLFADFGRDA